MKIQDRKRLDAALIDVDLCLEKAHDAIDAGSPVGAREWMDAADAAQRLANSIKHPTEKTA